MFKAPRMIERICSILCEPRLNLHLECISLSLRPLTLAILKKVIFMCAIYRLLTLAFCLGCFNTVAGTLNLGDPVAPISAKDQHGVNYTFTNGTRYMLIAVEMGPATTANHTIAGRGAGYLEGHGAVYMMDIHTMPEIGRFFAFPQMRKYPERIILIDTPHALDWVPVKTGCLTVLTLTPDGQIRGIAYWNPNTEPVSVCF
jgi:hypothetical protein